METLTVQIPRRGASFWIEVQEVGPMVTSLKQYDGPRLSPGQSCSLQAGSVVVKAHSTTFKRKAFYEVCVLLPDGTWYTAIDCTPPNCGLQLRERIRTWITLSLESRVIRAISEMIEQLNQEIDAYLDRGPSCTLEDAFVYTRLTQIDTLSNMAVAATGNKIVNDDQIFDEFQRWLEALAARTEIPPEKLYSMLIRGAQRSKTPHVNYLKKFNRAIRFKDNVNE